MIKNFIQSSLLGNDIHEFNRPTRHSWPNNNPCSWKLVDDSDDEIVYDKKTNSKGASDVKNCDITPTVNIWKKYQCYVGLDLSIHNPGIVCWVFDTDNVWHVYFIFFAKTDVQEKSGDYVLNHTKHDTVHVHFRHLAKKPKREDFEFDIDWYNELVDLSMNPLFEIIESFSISPSRVKVIIENYAFRCRDTSSLTKLCECAALVKDGLRFRNYKYKLRSNTTVKKWFGGHGHAKKEHMWIAFSQKEPEISKMIQTHFQWNYEEKKEKHMDNLETKKLKRGIKKQKLIVLDKEWDFMNESDSDEDGGRGGRGRGRGKKRRKLNSFESVKKAELLKAEKESKEALLKIPHPIEDLVDAYGLISTYLIVKKHDRDTGKSGKRGTKRTR